MSIHNISDYSMTKKGVSRTRLIHRIIREYGIVGRDGFEVNLNNLDHCDKRLLLSHVTDSGELEEACSTPTMFEAVFKEYRGVMEKLVDAECGEVYQGTMEEYRNYR